MKQIAWYDLPGWWAERSDSSVQVYLGILGATVLIAVAVLPSGPLPALETLVIGCVIASLARGILWRDERLFTIHDMLLQIASQECCCNPNAIITEATGYPELVGQPVGKGYCPVCRANRLLEEQFPGKIEDRINKHVFRDGPIPEDLLACFLTAGEEAWLRKQRSIVQQEKRQ
jgi:hypothetical protein